jgi:hypothetical protein
MASSTYCDNFARWTELCARRGSVTPQGRILLANRWILSEHVEF